MESIHNGGAAKPDTMELSKNFDHQQADNKWYQHWLDKKYFNSQPDGRYFII